MRTLSNLLLIGGVALTIYGATTATHTMQWLGEGVLVTLFVLVAGLIADIHQLAQKKH